MFVHLEDFYLSNFSVGHGVVPCHSGETPLCFNVFFSNDRLMILHPFHWPCFQRYFKLCNYLIHSTLLFLNSVFWIWQAIKKATSEQYFVKNLVVCHIQLMFMYAIVIVINIVKVFVLHLRYQ